MATINELETARCSGLSDLTEGLGVDARHRHEIIADLVAANKRIYDLEAVLDEVHSWAVCGCIASPDDMAKNLPRIVEITTPNALAEGAEPLLAKLPSTAGLGAWISTSWQLPSDETPVLIFRNGEICVGERRWDYPGFEDTYRAFWYWDDPNDDGRAWEDNNDVTHWMPLPEAPNAKNQGLPKAVPLD